jgi:hypothetical protein
MEKYGQYRDKGETSPSPIARSNYDADIICQGRALRRFSQSPLLPVTLL